MTPFVLFNNRGSKECGSIAPDMTGYHAVADSIPPLDYSDVLRRRRESTRPIGRQPISLDRILRMGILTTALTTLTIMAIREMRQRGTRG